jgi:hypothetical protein
MRTLIKLLLSAAVIYGSWQVGLAYWDWYQFRDRVQDAAQFSRGVPEAEVTARVAEIAAGLELPLDADQVSVRREKTHTFVDVEYMEQIEILPGVRVPWRFAVHVDAWTETVTR